MVALEQADPTKHEQTLHGTNRVVAHLHYMGFRVTWIIQQEQPEVSASRDLRATVASAFATVCSWAIQHGRAVQPWTI